MSKAQSIARLKMLREKGHLYVAYSRYCDWLKIGFTSQEVRARIDGINHQYKDFAPFSLIGSVESTWAAEQRLHRCLFAFRRQRRGLTSELYPAVTPLVRRMQAILQDGYWDIPDRDDTYDLVHWAMHTARAPLNDIELDITIERFDEERSAA